MGRCGEGTGPPGMGTRAMRTQRRQPTGSSRVMGLVFHRIERKPLHHRPRKATHQQGYGGGINSLPFLSLAKRSLIHGEFSPTAIAAEGFIHAARKLGEGSAKEWSRCLAVQVVRKRWRWKACLSEAGNRNDRAIFRRCCGSAASGQNHCKAKIPRFPASSAHDDRGALRAFSAARAISE